MRTGGDNACIEIISIEALQSYLRSERSLKGLAIQGLNLTSREMDYALTSLSAHGSYFLGCALTAKSEAHIRATGGTIFPDFHDLPFNAYRSSLYTVEELMEGYSRGNPASLIDTVDGKIYAYFQKHRVDNRPVPIIPALSFRIHDHSIDNALHDLLYPEGADPLKVVAVMGGHKMTRDDDIYLKTAKIASRLSKIGYFVTSGGGPGAMEATNLGGYFSEHPEQELEDAVRSMAKQPQYQDELYIDTAYEVMDRFPVGGRSLAIPTWFFGHEPTNLFASHIAKYFANSLREDGMLAIAKCGVIFVPGSAGTIQEIFMDAAQNRYKSYGVVSPMIFLGTRYWTKTKPVYPLLKTLAKDREYEKLVTLVDEPDEVVRFIRKNQTLPTQE